MNLSQETERLARRLRQRSLGILHGSLARGEASFPEYLKTSAEVDALVDLAAEDRTWRFEAVLGRLAQKHFNAGWLLTEIAGQMPEACHSIIFSELTEYLIETEHCTLAHLGRFEVIDRAGTFSVKLSPFGGIERIDQRQPSSSDIETQVAVNAWHSALEKHPRMANTLAAVSPPGYQTLAFAYLHEVLPEALSNVVQYLSNPITTGHTLFSMQAACLGYAAYSACVMSMATIVQEFGRFDVPLIGSFERAEDGRITFSGKPEFITLLSANLPLHA